MRTGPEVIKLFSCSAQLRLKFILLINVKMPTMNFNIFCFNITASVDCPLYILPHSKTMLTLAISHDSQFLSSNLVMDYSLLVGVDEEKRELVVGIIGMH